MEHNDTEIARAVERKRWLIEWSLIAAKTDTNSDWTTKSTSDVHQSNSGEERDWFNEALIFSSDDKCQTFELEWKSAHGIRFRLFLTKLEYCVWFQLKFAMLIK